MDELSMLGENEQVKFREKVFCIMLITLLLFLSYNDLYMQPKEVRKNTSKISSSVTPLITNL